MNDKDVSPDEIIRAATAVAVVAGVIGAAPALGLAFWFWKRPRTVREFGAIKLIACGTIIVLVGLCIWFLWLDQYPLYSVSIVELKLVSGLKWKHLLRIFDLGWWCGTGAVLIAAPLIPFIKKQVDSIRPIDFSGRVRSFRKIRKAFESPDAAPIGIDLRTGNVVSLSVLRRVGHVLGLGATGTGKSVLMIILILHAIRHRQPCVIIDPKGEDSTLDMIRRIGRIISSDFDERFRVFTMSKPEESSCYNPLKHGNANQLKDRILEALNWSEQYYQSIAGDFLTLLTACAEHVKIRLTLDTVAQSMMKKEVQADLLRRLRAQADAGDTKADDLYEKFALLLKNVKPDDLLGLQAQLSILNNPTMGHLLSFREAECEIDLREVLGANQIAYFQLDTLGNPDTARRLGRMIIEDLKGLASEVYKSVPEPSRKFFPIFIDEFGSFASKEFIEFLKQSRGAKFAAHLFCQGLEDLDVVSREFGRQARSNPMTKIALRLDDTETVNEVCSMVGTADSTEQSYQVEGTLTRTKTGMGNMRETKQMRVEHDVLKNLNVGQAVVIEKSPSRVAAIQVWMPNILEKV